MADQINDCQGEGPEFVERAHIKKPSDQLRDAWQDGPYGSVVLYAADLLDEQAKTISILRDDLAELSRLRSELEEAREIIGELIEGEEDHEGELRELLADAMKTDPSMIHVTHPAVARARAFLNKHSVTTKGD